MNTDPRALIFRLHPAPRTLYVRAVVHPTKKAMMEHWRGLVKAGFSRSVGRDAVGFCVSVHRLYRSRPSRPWRRDPCVAEVNLFRGRCGMEIVTHELLHATAAWGRRVRFDFTRLDAEDSVNRDEERLCYVHGRLCREFVERANAAGVYD